MTAETLLQKWRELAEWAANKAVEARNDNRHYSAEQYELIARFTKDHSDELEAALQADAREKGEAVAACCGRKECGGECGGEWRGIEAPDEAISPEEQKYPKHDKGTK